MEYDVLEAIKYVNRVLRRQQVQMSPDSNGRGHGKLLRAIDEHEGITGKELALMLNIRPPTLSEKLTLLEKDGNIIRVRDKVDRRLVRIYLTEEGHLALARRAHGGGRFKQRFCSALTIEEQKIFCSMCDRLVSCIEQMELEDLVPTENMVDFPRHRKAAGMRKAVSEGK